MADLPITIDNLKRVCYSNVHDPEKWAANMRLLRAAGLFVGSIVLMRNFSDALVNETP